MSRRNIFIFVLLVTVVGIGVFVYYLGGQYSRVTFILPGDVESATVYKYHEAGEPEIITTVSPGGGPSFIKKGVYGVKPKGDKIDGSAQMISITESSQDIDVALSYSRGYLSELASGERPQLLKSLEDSFQLSNRGFSVAEFRLFNDGSWGGVLFVPQDYDEQNPVILYRCLVSRQGDSSYKVVGKPELILTKFNTPNTPIDILEKINQLAL